MGVKHGQSIYKVIKIPFDTLKVYMFMSAAYPNDGNI